MQIEKTNENKVWGSWIGGRKTLYKWITEVDLDKWNILVKDPVSVRNFVTQYTDYTSDWKQFGWGEYWQDPNVILDTRNDDCEGLNNLACNILFTLGFDCRLSVGRWGYDNYTYDPSDRKCNHAYGLLFENEYDTNPYIIECTGDDLVEKLPKIDDHQEYYTWYTGSAVHQQNYKCGHLVGEQP